VVARGLTGNEPRVLSADPLRVPEPRVENRLPFAAMSADGSACGRYVLEREIARGGMGSIWVAWDPQLERRVGLKQLTFSPGSPEALARFEQEARLVARLSHPNVVQIYDYGTEDGTPYIVMELLDGEDLNARLRRVRTLPLSVVIDLVSQTARALTAAHLAGLVHRDLKPSNIFLAKSDTGETVKVLDFGVALMRPDASGAGSEAAAGALVGTPAFMSPEQARGRQVDQRSDSWSLAVVAYQALTGELPFSSQSIADLIGAICCDPVAPPSTHVRALGARVDAFFERAFARRMDARFQWATDLAAAFADLGREHGGRLSKILLVDDEPDVALLLSQHFRNQLESGAYELFFAENGAQALQELRMHPDIDVILSDIRMPGMDGLSLLRAVPDLAPMAKVIMVSAYGDMQNVRTAMNRGAYDFLFKPIDFQDLDATVEKAIRAVAQTRSAVRAMEESQVLRMLVHRGVVDRMLPLVRDAGTLPGESVEGTVALFDVHGSMALLNDRRPDEAIAIFNANIEVVLPEILARSGVVERFVADAVLAVFVGEEHQARAGAAAAAAIQALLERAGRMGPDSPYVHGLTVGIESGRLICGALGSRALSRLEYTVLGPAVATACRLETLADKNEIVVGPAAHQALSQCFECAPLPDATEAAAASGYRVVRWLLDPATPLGGKTTLSMPGRTRR
jgi:serine/threonine protein kinase